MLVLCSNEFLSSPSRSATLYTDDRVKQDFLDRETKGKGAVNSLSATFDYYTINFIQRLSVQFFYRYSPKFAHRHHHVPSKDYQVLVAGNNNTIAAYMNDQIGCIT